MSREVQNLIEALERAFPVPEIRPGGNQDVLMYQAGAAKAVATARHMAEHPE